MKQQCHQDKTKQTNPKQQPWLPSSKMKPLWHGQDLKPQGLESAILSKDNGTKHKRNIRNVICINTIRYVKGSLQGININ